nr:uncharacterized protein LOC112770286 [Arachis hypogaea]
MTGIGREKELTPLRMWASLTSPKATQFQVTLGTLAPLSGTWDLALYGGRSEPHGEGTSGDQHQRRIPSEVRFPKGEEQPHSADLIGLLHGHQGRLEQLEQELEQQCEVERSLRKQIKRRRELEEKLSKLESNLQSKDSRTAQEDTPLGGEDPFTEDILRAKVPRNFKSPGMNLYNGTIDPKHHLGNFKSWMYLADASDATRCKAFPTTLTKVAMKWFDSLPPRSVTNFDDLAHKFLTRFSIQKDKVKHAPSLPRVKQEVKEPLRDYIERFNKVCLKIQDLPTEAVIIELVNGLREGSFSQSISKRHPTSLNDVQERAERKICHIEKLPPPCPIKTKKGGSHNEYCEYHKLYGHSTNDCYDLKNVIEKLATEGRLDRYLMERSDSHRKRKKDDEDLDQRGPPPQTPERHVHMILGGFAGGGLIKRLG